MPRNGEIFLEYIPERRIFRYSCDVNYFDQDESGYEYMLRQMKTNLVANNMPLSYFTNIGTIIRREHLVPDSLFSNEVFLFVDEDDSSQAMETLPAASYLCLCSDEFSMEAANVRRLLDYVQTRGCEIAGDYICEVVVDFPMLDFDRRRVGDNLLGARHGITGLFQNVQLRRVEGERLAAELLRIELFHLCDLLNRSTR